MINVNGYQILYNALKDNSFINELSLKYGKEFTDNIIDYFDGKYDNTSQKIEIEKQIDEKLEEILNMIFNRNINIHSTTRTNSQTQTQTNDNDYTIGQNYSKEIAMNALNDEISDLEKETAEIERAIQENDLKNKKLRKELQQKKALLSILKENKKQIDKNNSLNEKLAKKDEKLNTYYTALEEKKEKLNSITNSTNRKAQQVINKKRMKLQKEIATLEKKIGTLQTRQRKVTNKKLLNIYKQSKKNANKIGNENARNIFRQERDSNINKIKQNLENNMSSLLRSNKNNNFITSKLNNAKYNLSYHKYNIINRYCDLLRLKDGKIDGLRQLPEQVKQAVTNSISTKASSIGFSR